MKRLAALAFAACVLPAAAQFPDKPVRIVVAFAPGTGSDVLARLVANSMGPIVGGTVIVENRPGGGGIVGTESVARSAADGYTLALGTTSTLVTNPALNPNVKYSVDKDFAPVAGLGKAWYVIVTANTPEAPKSLTELIARLKAQPSPFASAGQGTITHLASEMFVHRMGVKNATHVPYKGSGQALTDVAGGQVLFASDTIAAALPLIRGGKLRALAVTAPERVATLPDVPTTKELGFADLRAHAWLVLVAPAGTPAPVIAKLSDSAIKAMNTADMKEKLKAQELEPMLLDPKALGEFIRNEAPYWNDFIKQTGIRGE
ncbi:MAG TPA: tripartite tricarboxylate transporter substrate binding protein [Casimicrobiaceae bacterium]|nr:tripartite tricarboxylate transporter substrate binding protein [Casimicrobiaceae bacterium]